MVNVDVACCANNNSILNSMLLEGLRIQKEVNTHLHIINPEMGYKSAAQSYNSLINTIFSDYIIFAHQDIKLLEDDIIYNMTVFLDQFPNTIIGLCGAVLNGQQLVYGNIYHGILNTNMGIPVDKPVKVETLDECFIMMKREVLNVLKFDDKLLDGWHFYVVDFCLQAKQKGYSCFVWNQQTQHKNVLEMPRYLYSVGIYPKEFYKYLRIMRSKYIDKLDYIVSPCCYFKTKFIPFYMYYISSIFKRRIKYIFRIISI